MHAAQMAEELDDQKAYGNQGIDHELELTRHLKIVKAERDETARELSFERQINQQTEEAMVKLTGRVKEMQAELAEQEVEKMVLLREVQALRNANFRLEKEADKNYTGNRAA